ncbi:MAG TPA: cupredoxin domain-containing protein [Nitrososphaera sp.]|nr:cupredoxin domain-containing protein [Nitrososphaera sp.]
MRKALTLGFILVLIFPTLAAEQKESRTAPNVVKVGNPAPGNAPTKEVEVSARKYEYTPGVIEVPINTLVKIHLQAVDREHGFEMKSFKDSCVKFKPNEPAIVEFYADKTGEYEFNCCKFCGLGHGKMKGKLVVK